MQPLDRIVQTLNQQWKPVAALLAVAGSALLYAATARNVQVIVDGEPIQGFSHARTVGAVLRDFGIEVGPEDQVHPELSETLRAIDQIQIIHARPVLLEAEGHLEWVQATQDNPVNILAEENLRLYPGDKLWIDGQPIDEPEDSPVVETRIKLVRGHALTIADGRRVATFRSAASTVGQALYEQGIQLYEGDRVEPPLSTPLTKDTEVTLERAYDLDVIVDGAALTVKAAAGTVDAALASAGISLSGLDYTIPPAESPVPGTGQVQVVRVAEQVLIELEPVPFETVYQPLETLELDSIQVVEAGTYGVLENRVRIRMEDGIEITRVVEDARVVIEPEPRRLGYGTKIVVQSMNTPYGTIEYWRAIPIYATSYSPCNLGVNYCGDRTASGKEVDRGVIGVIRTWYNLMRGWPVFIPGYGPGTIEDIGGGIAGRDWIDLGFTDENFEPWHQWTTLYFLTPVPPLDSIPWILP